MPRLKHKPPAYRLHKASGQAVVTFDGRDHYLGRHGSPESQKQYHDLLARWTVSKSLEATPAAPKDDIRIAELLKAYLEWAKKYYVKNGRPTGELSNMRHAMAPLSALFAERRVADFSTADLRTARQTMVDAGLSRKVINNRINRVRRIFKWGVEHELVNATALHALQAVSPLRRGRSAAPDTDPIVPVPTEDITAIMEHLAPQVQAMVSLQRLTGMRPGEVVIMRGCDIDSNDEVWNYVPATHKTEHHGHSRRIPLGPRAQEVIRPFMRDDPSEHLFNPREAADEQRRRYNDAKYGTDRKKTKPKRKRSPSRQPGTHYTTASYGYAIRRACEKVGVQAWGPNRLRHNAATELRARYGIEAARVILGHRSAEVTEIYAELDRGKAREIMAEVG